jgi:hypothetical protein
VETLYKLIELHEIAADERDGTRYIRKSVLDEWLDKPATSEELDALKRLIDSAASAEPTRPPPADMP